MAGKLEVVCGSMFSGKTEELLRRMQRFTYAKKGYILFKPLMDARYSENEVVSHNKNKLLAINISNAEEIETFCAQHPDIKSIGIDEVQFINVENPKKVIDALFSLKRKGYHIIVAGLDMDSTGRSFSMMPELMAMADEVHKLKAVCFDCGADASMSHRIHGPDSVIQIGAAEQYKALCFECWNEQNPEKK